MKRATLDALREARRQRRGVALVTVLETGAQTLAAAGAGAATGVAPSESGEIFTQLFVPPPRLVVVGAVHIAQKLVQMAQLAEFAVTIVDPRRAFATAERFPGVSLVYEWPDRALAKSPPDIATALVTLSHDPKLDDPALVAALGSPAFYIGALGSKKTHAKRLDRLRAAGFGDDDLQRVHAPIGLPIGAVSPGEIAVAIMAEIVGVRRGQPQRPVKG